MKLTLRNICIDCRTDDLTAAVGFWSAVLSLPVENYEEGADGTARRYAGLGRAGEGPGVLLQKVDHAPRVHLDLEAPDPEAAIREIERLGGRVVQRLPDWTVVEAPTGHRFCVMAQG